MAMAYSQPNPEYDPENPKYICDGCGDSRDTQVIWVTRVDEDSLIESSVGGWVLFEDDVLVQKEIKYVRCTCHSPSKYWLEEDCDLATEPELVWTCGECGSEYRYDDDYRSPQQRARECCDD